MATLWQIKMEILTGRSALPAQSPQRQMDRNLSGVLDAGRSIVTWGQLLMADFISAAGMYGIPVD